MSHPQHTISAQAYIRSKRKENPGEATWFDVADAYDWALYHAVEAPDNAKRALAELQARKEKLRELASEPEGQPK